VETSGSTSEQDQTAQVADDAPRVQSPDEALQQDAESYAQLAGVTVQEARRRLRASREVAPLRSQLQSTHSSRFGGLSLEHNPSLRIIVRLTGNTPVPDTSLGAGEFSVPVVFQTGAQATHRQLLAALRQHQAAIRSLLPLTQGIGIDSRSGELVVAVNATGAAVATLLSRDTELETLTGVPVRIQAFDGVDRNADVRVWRMRAGTKARERFVWEASASPSGSRSTARRV